MYNSPVPLFRKEIHFQAETIGDSSVENAYQDHKNLKISAL